MEKKTLPTDISERIDGLLREAGAKNREGQIEQSITLGQLAWALLPPPQEEWDFYPQIMARSMVTKYAAIGDAASAKEWIATTYRVYEDIEREDHFVLMLEGRALYQLGLIDEAYEVFSRIHQLFGRQGFSGDEAPYLEFYLKERAARQK